MSNLVIHKLKEVQIPIVVGVMDVYENPPIYCTISYRRDNVRPGTPFKISYTRSGIFKYHPKQEFFWYSGIPEKNISTNVFDVLGVDGTTHYVTISSIDDTCMILN